MADPTYDPPAAWQQEPDWAPRSRYARPSAPARRSAPGEEPLSDLLLLGLGRTLWAYSLELLLLALLVAPTLAGEVYSHSFFGSFASVVLFSLTIGVAPVRRCAARALRVTSTRRCWHRAHQSLHRSGRCGMQGRRVEITKVHHRPFGEILDVRVPMAATVTDLERLAESLAAMLGIRDVRVRRDARNARHARVSLIRREPLSSPAPAWPHARAERLSLWDPIPVGMDEDGNPVTLSLPEHNVLLGGEPGAGKSAALSLLVATAALDPCTRLHLLDGKLVELAVWAGCADSTAGVDIEDANLLLGSLRSEMDTRYATLLANRARKVRPDMDLPLHLVVVDELAHYLFSGDRKDRALFAELMRDLVSRGRAAGIIVLAATQKPQHDVVPTALRDLFGFRWALRCATPQASDTILGSGWASQGHSASDINAAHRGVGLLLHEGEQPIRLRSHYLDDDTLAQIALRAEGLRRQSSAKEEL
jgi:hypothetical protein